MRKDLRKIKRASSACQIVQLLWFRFYNALGTVPQNIRDAFAGTKKALDIRRSIWLRDLHGRLIIRLRDVLREYPTRYSVGSGGTDWIVRVGDPGIDHR